jgi:hypothetical protein
VPEPVVVKRVLECAECGRQSEPGATGWRAYLGTEEEIGPEDEVYAFCPECAEREFGCSR